MTLVELPHLTVDIRLGKPPVLEDRKAIGVNLHEPTAQLDVAHECRLEDDHHGRMDQHPDHGASKRGVTCPERLEAVRRSHEHTALPCELNFTDISPQHLGKREGTPRGVTQRREATCSQLSRARLARDYGHAETLGNLVHALGVRMLEAIGQKRASVIE